MYKGGVYVWIASVEADLYGQSKDSHTLYAKRLAIRTCYPLVKDPSGGCFNNRTSLPFQEPGIMLSFIDKRAQTSGLLSGTQPECPLIFSRRNFPKGPELLDRKSVV